MATVTISDEYEVEIPREVRESMGLRPGATLQVFQYDDRIELIPVRPLAEMRGAMPGIPTDVEPDDDDRV